MPGSARPETRRRERASLGMGAATVAVLLLLLAACSATARVVDVTLALDGAAARERNVFFTDTKEIHCVVEMGIGRPGTTIEAIIRQLQYYDFQADRFSDADRVAANAEAAPQPMQGIQRLDVVMKPKGPNGEDAEGAPFPPGRFQCEAYLDGHLEKVAIFNIDFPDCPTAAIKVGSECFGFYKNLSVCPKYGATSRDSAMCRCQILSGWECDK